MFSGKYVSLDYVLEMAESFVGSPINWLDAAERVGRAMRLIGAPNAFSKEVETLTIEEYRAELPGNLIEIKHVRECEQGIGMQTASDESIMAYKKNGTTDSEKIAYTVNDNFIFTNFEEGTIELHYTAYPVDERGMPRIPDQGKYIEAMAWFIAQQEAFKLWRDNTMSDKVYMEINRERLFYMAAAKTSMGIPSLDQMEALKNMIVRSIPRVNEHTSSYKHTSTREQRYNHKTG